MDIQENLKATEKSYRAMTNRLIKSTPKAVESDTAKRLIEGIGKGIEKMFKDTEALIAMASPTVVASSASTVKGKKATKTDSKVTV